MEEIIKKENQSKEMQQIEELFINSAVFHTDDHILKYLSYDSSLGGRYINSDLFKETFPMYAESVESRNKYHFIVHNSSAVLAKELFLRVVKSKDIKKCIFVGGIPGSGKSYFVQSLISADVIADDVMIYDGNLSAPSIMEDIATALDKGKEVSIVIINPTLELSQRNIINRCNEVGRDISFRAVATIGSGLAKRLKEIHQQFPNIPLTIYDKQNNFDVNCLVGWKYLSLLDKGNYDEIMSQLTDVHEKIMVELSNKSLAQKELKKEKKYLF